MRRTVSARLGDGRSGSAPDFVLTLPSRSPSDLGRKAQPIISVDTKHKELVGRFKNPGRTWSAQPVQVKDHDFRSEALGMAIPYGICDLQANCGSVSVGTTHDTPQFAVESIGHGWRRQGKPVYGADSHLLILADGGGSNGYRCRAWEWALLEHLLVPCGITVTVGHYPTGASKWNPIEHNALSPPKPELVSAHVLGG